MGRELASSALILIVDDAETNQYLFSRTLKKEGYETDCVSSAHDCFSFIQKHKPDLIILDVNLPDQSGYEVCHQLKGHPQFCLIPILQVSAGYSKNSVTLPGIEVGADGYLAAPVEPAILVANVNALLRMSRAEMKYEKLLLELREAVRARDEFLSIASHELKTPLTSLKLHTYMTQKSFQDNQESAISPDKVKRLVVHVDRQVERLSGLIDDMLDISRIANGKLSLNCEKFDLSEMVEDVTSRLSLISAQAGCDLRVKIQNGVVGTWDRNRLEQVLVNLITNGVKYGAGSPIEIELFSENDQDVVITVRDYGRGIAPEDHERIFERFERAIPASEISGLGLGLYIVKQILEMHHGSIRVESEPNQGAKFIVTVGKSYIGKAM